MAKVTKQEYEKVVAQNEMEEAAEKRAKEVAESLKETIKEFRKNGTKNLKTLDELLVELENEED